MGDNTALTVVLAFLGVIMLIGVVLLGVMLFVIYRYRVPLRGIAAMAGALLYLVSPVDVLPEAVLGPFGLIDDAGVLGVAGMFVYHLIQARRAVRPVAGPDHHEQSREHPENQAYREQHRDRFFPPSR